MTGIDKYISASTPLAPYWLSDLELQEDKEIPLSGQWLTDHMSAINRHLLREYPEQNGVAGLP